MPTLRTTMLRTTTLPTHRPTDPGASFGDASSNAPNHTIEHGQHAAGRGQHAAESAGSASAIERQAWRFPKDQVADLFTLCGTHGHR
jgi:hypothetical protein